DDAEETVLRLVDLREEVMRDLLRQLHVADELLHVVRRLERLLDAELDRATNDLRDDPLETTTALRIARIRRRRRRRRRALRRCAVGGRIAVAHRARALALRLGSVNATRQNCQAAACSRRMRLMPAAASSMQPVAASRCSRPS